MCSSRAEPTSARCYARVSTEEQAVSGYSLSAQQAQLQSYLERMGWNCAAWYIDEGKSAKDLNRPEFQRMIQEVRPGEVILVTKLDRLTRSVRDLDDLLREFGRRGLAFQSATEQFETRTPGGRLYMQIVAVIAQWEREVIADRSSTGKKQKVIQGEWAGGPVPFGYRGEPSGRFKRGRELLRLVPDPETAHVVRQIFERYTSGHGMRAVCTWLNDELRVPTARGARWRVSSLSRLLTNPLYAGFVTHGRRKAGPVISVRGAHRNLVSEELFSATQRMFETRRTMAPRQATGMYPLSGIVRCGVCGGLLDSALRRHRQSYTYRCRNYVNGTGCGDGSARSNSGIVGYLLEDLVVNAMAQLPPPTDWPRFQHHCGMEGDAGAAGSPAEIARLMAAASRAEQAVRRWEAVFEAGKISWDELQEKARGHLDTLQALRGQLECANEAAAQPSRTVPPPSVFDLKLAWRYLTPPERKALLQEFTHAFRLEIRVFPDRRVELAPVQDSLPPSGCGRAPRKSADTEHGWNSANPHAAESAIRD